MIIWREAKGRGWKKVAESDGVSKIESANQLNQEMNSSKNPENLNNERRIESEAGCVRHK